MGPTEMNPVILPEMNQETLQAMNQEILTETNRGTRMLQKESAVIMRHGH